MKKELTIIIPVYNEEKGIKNTIEVLNKFIEQEDKKWEILVINDGSSDRTKEILKEMSYIRVIYHPLNKGYGAALKTGIRNSDTDYVSFYDADGQHNPKDLNNLYINIEDFDMLVGQRGADSHQSWVRKPGKLVLGKVANFLTGRKIPDLNSGLRVVNRELIKNLLHLFPDGFSFSTTSTVAFMNLGYNVGYTPIKVAKRVGKSSVKQLRDGTNTLMLILRLVILFNPLKIFMPVSFTLIFIGIMYELFWGIILIDSFKLVQGALLLFLVGVMIFFFGLVVDQISELRKNLNIKS